MHHSSSILHSLAPWLPEHVLGAIFVSLLLLVTMYFARIQLLKVMRSPEGGIIPDSKLTYRNFFEICAEKLYEFTASVIGEHAAHIYYPMIGTLFVFVFLSNFIGLIPGFLPPTDNINTTLALGLFVFIYYNYLGFKENGVAYIKHFFGPLIWIAPLMFVIELVSHIVRPLSLGLRLRGNIFGDHLVLSIFNEMIGAYGLSFVFYFLGAFVSFIQAFVFCLLTMVYISMAVAHEH